MVPPIVSQSAAVASAFRSLPDRYLGAPEGFDATYHVRIGDIGRTWEVRVTPHAARVRAGVTSRRPDVTIGTDAETWLALREGAFSGIEAFSARRLYVRGDMDQAIGFEGLFRLPNGRPPLVRVHDVKVSARLTLSALTMGSGPDVLLLHGLGATKASFFETAAALADRYTVHALDLPGFGSSSKPLGAPYTAAYHARAVLGAMDALGIDRARLVGNSMGGRVALELGLAHPDRVVAIGLLCPATAFVRRDLWPLVRLARPELALLPHSLGRGRVAAQFWDLFADRDLVDPAAADIAVDEFQRLYRSAAARLAFLTSARALYLEQPFGRDGFFPRLSGLRPPALFIWGTHDRLIPAGFRHHVARHLPSAEQVLLHGCGHVPQIERPQHTHGILRRFFGQRGRARGRIHAARGVKERGLSPFFHGVGLPRMGETREHADPHAGGNGSGDPARLAVAQAPEPRGDEASDGEPRSGGDPLASLLRVPGALARGIAGQITSRIPAADLDERDPDYIRERLPAMWLLASLWHRAEVRGLGNIPEDGGVLLVGNHSGGNMSPDTTVFSLAFNSYFGVERAFYQLAHNLVMSMPGLGFLRKFGTVAAGHENARKALKAGAAVLVYPGGDVEVHRSTLNRHRIDFAGRRGFIRLALEANVPIVPVVSIGGQETALFLTPGRGLARLLALDRLFRLKALPISLAVPWGLNVGDMLGHIPLPAKIVVEALPPIDLYEEFGSDPDIDEIYEHILRAMQETLDALAAERRLPLIG